MSSQACASRKPAVIGFQPQVHVLQPGDVVSAHAGERLETLLGSCVAVILTDLRRSIGVMCHFVHAGVPRVVGTASTTHGGLALPRMFERVRAEGLVPACCEAYVLGGGNMFPALVEAGHVGDRNSRWALDFLEKEGIRMIASDVGGHAYRRVSWTIGQGAPNVTAVPV